jgi:hypothetical protein
VNSGKSRTTFGWNSEAGITFKIGMQVRVLNWRLKWLYISLRDANLEQHMELLWPSILWSSVMYKSVRIPTLVMQQFSGVITARSLLEKGQSLKKAF